ncbi:MAG TPA: hypothetical protein VLB46_19125, partial [Pyrinomonadaceae bacterium]|nr:hypothetical protein [Pyrinomonadaceae bacterium]
PLALWFRSPVNTIQGRRASRFPLAIIFRAVGAVVQITGERDPGATRFALAPGYYISRRWRCGSDHR